MPLPRAERHHKAIGPLVCCRVEPRPAAYGRYVYAQFILIYKAAFVCDAAPSFLMTAFVRPFNLFVYSSNSFV